MSEVPNSDEKGAISRALLWVVGGLLLAVAAFVALTPEVAGSQPRVIVELVGVVALAAVPGLVLLVLFAIRRKRLGLDAADDLGDQVGTDRHRRPHPEQER